MKLKLLDILHHPVCLACQRHRKAIRKPMLQGGWMLIGTHTAGLGGIPPFALMDHHLIFLIGAIGAFISAIAAAWE